ncbi:hypothetical protein AHAS_Ahas03G0226600 [Arachis hypogaea]
MGVPLEVEGVPRQPLNLTLACHLSNQAWHAIHHKQDLGMPLSVEGVKAWHATYWNNTRSWAWHANLQAWHAGITFQKVWKKPITIGMPLELEGVALQ